MGFLDRIGSARRYVWSPLTVVLLERGSDTVVRAGQSARVVVDVEGEDDGTAERIELTLALDLRERTWPLGEVPITPGRHEVEVQIPVDAPPSSAATKYFIKGRLHRTKGMHSEGYSPVFVIGDPAHAYRAPDPQSGSDDPGLAVSVDTDPVVLGATVSGRVTGTAERVEVGAVVDASYGYDDGTSKQKRQFQKVGEVTPDAAGAFAVAIPVDGLPSLYDGEDCRITWEARAIAGGSTAWRRFVVLDPEGTTNIPQETSSVGRLLT